MKDNERILIALPAGELQDDTTRLLQIAKIDFEFSGENLLASATNIPIDFLKMRASDVPLVVNNSRSDIVAGITGSDILWENGLDKDSGYPLPVAEYFPDTIPAYLYIGATQNLPKDPPVACDLEGSLIATKFPVITGEILKDEGVKEFTIFQAGGKIEGIQFAFKNCRGIVDIEQTGKTRSANGIRVIKKFHEVSTRLVIAEGKLSPSGEQIIADFRGRIAIAQQNR